MQQRSRRLQGVSKKTQHAIFMNVRFAFEQQKVYLALGFEPLASISGLNVELVLCRISLSGCVFF